MAAIREILDREGLHETEEPVVVEKQQPAEPAVEPAVPLAKVGGPCV